MKKRSILLIPSIFILFSCVTNNNKSSNKNCYSYSYSQNGKVNVKFNANGGTITSGLSYQKVDKDTAFGSVSAPSVKRKISTGYKENPGWYYLNGSEKVVVNSSTVISSDITLYANWNTHNVTFNSGIGTWNGSASETKEIKDTTYINSDDIKSPTYAGGKFLGWYKGDDKVSFPYTPTEDVTLTAKYDVKQISIFFNGNGGTISSSPTKIIKVDYGTSWNTIKGLEEYPSNVDYTGDYLFDGWRINGSEIASNYEFKKATVITAQASEAISVTFNVSSNGGVWNDTSSSIDKKIKIRKSESHTFADFKAKCGDSKTSVGNYEELGWYPDALANGTKVNGSDNITSSTTYYCYYKVPYSISFDKTNYSIEETITTFNRNSTITYTLKPNEDYKFANGVDPTITYDSKFTNVTKSFTIDSNTGYGTLTISNAPGSDISIAIAPVRSHYNIKFDSTGGSAVSPIKVLAGEKATAPTVPSQNGYTFDGWWTTSDYQAGTEFDFTTTNINQDYTLYAKWLTGEFKFKININSFETDVTTIDGVNLYKNNYSLLAYVGSDNFTNNVTITSSDTSIATITDETSYKLLNLIAPGHATIKCSYKGKVIEFDNYEYGSFDKLGTSLSSGVVYYSGNTDLSGDIYLPSRYWDGSNFITLKLNLGTTTAETCESFNGCTYITNVIFAKNFYIPERTDESKANIGASLFNGCIRLKSVTFPKIPTNTKMRGACFYNCTSLSSITFPENFVNIGSDTFDSKSGTGMALTTANLPSTLTTIGNDFFYGCPYLTTINFANSKSAFQSLISGKSTWKNKSASITVKCTDGDLTY